MESFPWGCDFGGRLDRVRIGTIVCGITYDYNLTYHWHVTKFRNGRHECTGPSQESVENEYC